MTAQAAQVEARWQADPVAALADLAERDGSERVAPTAPPMLNDPVLRVHLGAVEAAIAGEVGSAERATYEEEQLQQAVVLHLIGGEERDLPQQRVVHAVALARSGSSSAVLVVQFYPAAAAQTRMRQVLEGGAIEVQLAAGAPPVRLPISQHGGHRPADCASSSFAGANDTPECWHGAGAAALRWLPGSRRPGPRGIPRRTERCVRGAPICWCGQARCGHRFCAVA